MDCKMNQSIKSCFQYRAMQNPAEIKCVIYIIFIFCVIYILLLFNVYVDGVERQMNARVLGKGLKLLSVNGDRFETNSCYLQMIQH